MKILLVEDEPAVAGFIKKGFESEGFQLDIAYDGQTGRIAFLKDSFDVVILDVNIPIINGFDLCKIFKQQNNQIPIIMLTAFDSIDNNNHSDDVC